MRAQRAQSQASSPRPLPDGSPRRIVLPPGDAGRRGVVRPLPDPVAIRLCPVPDNAPPYDDELPGDDGPARPEVIAAALTATLQPGTGELDGGERCCGEGRGTQPAARTAPAKRAASAGRAAPAGRTAAGRAAAVGRAAPAGPDWPSTFAQILAETLAGSRPPAQMTRWTTERTRSHIRRLGPLLTAGAQPRVRRVIASCPAAGVVEMAVVVGFGSRVRALAVRLERTEPGSAANGLPGGRPRWVCTAVEAA